MVWMRVECEFSGCEAGAMVWGYLGPLGAGTALLALLVVLPAGTAVLSTPMSSLAERKCPEVRARCFVSGLWLGQDFLCVSGAPLARWQGPCTVFKSGCTLLGGFSSALGVGIQPLAYARGWSGLRLVSSCSLRLCPEGFADGRRHLYRPRFPLWVGVVVSYRPGLSS